MGGIKLEAVSMEDAERIFQAGLRILEKTGAMVHSDEALALLRNAGCTVEDKLVKLPPALILKALESAPACIDMYNREGKHAMALGGYSTYYGPGVTCPSVFDPYTMERKDATKQFVKDVATVADGLENINFLMSLCMVGDKTPLFADLQELHALIETSPKPLLTWAFSKENLAAMIEMAEVAVGGAEALKAKPYIMVYAEPTTPLVHSKEAMEKVMLLAEKGVPCVYSPGMTLGGTTPVTLAGALSVGFADCLVGLVVHQLTCPGSPIILGANGGALDMSTFQSAYSSLEMCLLESAANQIFRKYGVPSFGLAGATDAKCLDMQAAADAMTQCLMSTFSSSNLVHDFGMMDIGMTGCIQALVICNEMAGMASYLKRSITVNEETLAADVVHDVGPGGLFIAEEHTVANFRESLYTSDLLKRTTYETWEANGKKTWQDLAQEKVARLLKEHKPTPLPADKKAQLDAILERITGEKA